MDWYYPVLGGPVRGAAALDRLDAGLGQFVVPGLGVRCVSDEPWVTGAETCELALALDAIGDTPGPCELFAEIQHLRDADGGYWTGWQFANQAHFPDERSSWTAAAMVLAADALSGASGGAGIFTAGSARWGVGSRDAAAAAASRRAADRRPGGAEPRRLPPRPCKRVRSADPAPAVAAGPLQDPQRACTRPR